MKKTLFFLFAVTAMVCGCQREDLGTKVKDYGQVTFRIEEGSYSFATKATESALENGDKVQILAGAPINAASEATVSDGNKLVLANPIYWVKNQTATTKFVAIYPGQSQTTTVIDNYKLIDELGVHNYEYHNLFMAASATGTPGNTVELNFKHPFSKILINITNQLNSDPVSSVSVNGIIMDAALNLEAGTVSLEGRTPVNANAVELQTNNYALIVMPQTATPSLVVNTESGKSFKFVLSQAFEFKAGTYSTANLTISDGSTPDHGEAVAFSFQVTPWADGGGLNYSALVKKWFVYGGAPEQAWSDVVALERTEEGTEDWEGTWEGDFNYVAGFKFKLRWGSDNQDWSRQAGMNPEWKYYGTGDSEKESYLWGEGGNDIVLGTDYKDEAVVYPEAGVYHVKFVHDGYKLFVTKK